MKILPILTLSLLIAFSGYSQQTADFTIGPGYTLVDLDKLIEKDEIAGTRLEDWNQFSIGFSAQYFFTSLGEFQFGAEVMYQHLYWYRVIVPFGSTPIDREYTVTTFRLTPLFRVGEEDMNFDFGPTLNFNDGLEIGAMISGNKYFPLSDNIDLPIKIRVDLINSIVLVVPVSVHTGIRMKF
ncbi:hypothetical protein [Ekhidna sp. To15]|uniref:hypothetical protein n=1 Tax=Ekhidna sp. To15 TaxID=3395267 RepID=UPI003F527EFB